MVRKSKEEAEKTRQQILDAARQVFAEQGVSRTSLDQIAKAAGVTRGAIYWHFQNKSDVFFAMKQQIPLPLLEISPLELTENPEQNPLKQLENFLLSLFEQMEQDECLRDTFEIMNFKCEYVDEFFEVHQKMMLGCSAIVKQFDEAYQAAAARKQLKAGLDPELCAWESFLFFSGLIRFWLADTDGQQIRFRANTLIRNHLLSRQL